MQHDERLFNRGVPRDPWRNAARVSAVSGRAQPGMR